MALPKLKTPLFDVTIPSTGKDAKFRPFLVKEEKILLMAQSAGDRKSLIGGLQQIINNCVVSVDHNTKIDVDKLTNYDIEYLFLKIRSKSVDNIVELSYIDNEDEKEYKFKVNLDDITLKSEKNHTNRLKLEDDVGVILRYPTAAELNSLSEDLTMAEISVEVVTRAIESIYDKDNVYETKDITEEELKEFVDSLPIKAFEDVQKYLETMPKMYHKIEYKNSKGTDRVIELSTLEDFFTFA